MTGWVDMWGTTWTNRLSSPRLRGLGSREPLLVVMLYIRSLVGRGLLSEVTISSHEDIISARDHFKEISCEVFHRHLIL